MIWKLSTALALVVLTLISQARAGESEEYREEKTVSVTLGGGWVVAPVSATAIELGYFMTPDLLIQAEYSTGTEGVLFYTLGASMLGVSAKYFIGNSFYVKGGLADRQLDIKDVTCFLCDPGQPALGSYGYVSSLVAQVAIGNEWQFKYLAIGCDWFGVEQPFAVLGSHTTPSVENQLSPSQQSDLNNAWNDLGHARTFELLHFYLGLSF